MCVIDSTNQPYLCRCTFDDIHTKIADLYSSVVRFFLCFREDPDIKGFFDFKVRRGASRERNAIRVLQRMGFPSKIVSAALSTLETLPKP